MASYKLANYIIMRNFAARNKCSPCLLVSERNYCSKDNKTETENASGEERLSKEEEKLEEKSAKADSTSTQASDSDSATKSAAKQKLMSLLSGIKIVTDKPAKTSNLNLAKPGKRIPKKERLREMQEKNITPDKRMDVAVKAVASSFKEDPEKIESELTAKLSTLKLTEKPVPQDEADDVDDTDLNNEVNEKIMSSVGKVADTISESPIPARSELTKRLMRLSIDQKLESERKSMRSVIQGMTIQSQKPAIQTKTAEVPKPIKRMAPPKIGRVNLFGSSPLNIFSPDAEIKEDSSNKFWRELQERELRLLTQFAPANAFEEMIMWTEQGKHWKLPVDNETEMGEEEKIGFHEHVFLEHHLKGFPTKGPVRQFMELVVVGMSKNPYITVERKLDHIEWFRTYFKEKEDILREEGAIE